MDKHWTFIFKMSLKCLKNFNIVFEMKSLTYYANMIMEIKMSLLKRNVLWFVFSTFCRIIVSAFLFVMFLEIMIFVCLNNFSLFSFGSFLLNYRYTYIYLYFVCFFCFISWEPERNIYYDLSYLSLFFFVLFFL